MIGKTKTTNLFAAGLAKPFLVLADRLCKNKGRIAAVLPNSILSRETWLDIRKAISDSYIIEYVIISYASGTPNFSSDTLFREILLVLRKDGKDKSDAKTRIVNLLTQIDELKLHEIDALAFGIKTGKEKVILPGKGPSTIATTRELNWYSVKPLSDNWYRLAAFKNLELTEHHLNIVDNYCTPLSSCFTIGSVVDHTDGLVVSNKPQGEGYNAVWGSGEKAKIKKIRDTPHHFVVITDRDSVKCNIWREEFASKLMILRRGQLDTQYTLMFMLDKNAVSNVWWPLHPVDKLKPAHVLSTLAFMNSTLGLIHILGERLETRGLWMELKKGQLTNLPLPAFEKLGVRNLKRILKKNGLSITNIASLPKIRDYVARMAVLEAKFGSYKDAIQEALKDSQLKPKAVLDKVSIELLELLGCSIPKNMYQLVFDEIKALRIIMESTNENADIIKDKGARAIKDAADKLQKKLDVWS